MAEFLYEAIDTRGRRIDGVEEAEDQQALAEALIARGLQPVNIKKSGGLAALLSRPITSSSKIKLDHLLHFTRELADLLAAGVTLERALAILADSAESQELNRLILSIKDEIHGGKRLSEALSSRPGVFSRLYVNMVRVGELGGALPQVLERLADFLERSRNIRRFIISSSIYPSILVLVGIVSITILVAFVVPKFGQIFQDLGQPVPLMTRVIIDASMWLQNWWWLLFLILLALAAGLWLYLRSPEGRASWDRWVLSVKIVGDFLRRVELSRFCRTLGTLLESGVPILKGISLASEVVTNSAIREAAMELYKGVRQGRSLSLLMKQSDVFPPLMVHLVSVGEETGALDRMLLKIADDFEQSIQNDTKMFLAMIEPVTIVVMGIVIGGIILSMLLAIFGINDVSF